MVTFKDIQFKRIYNNSQWHGTCKFENGYTLSVAVGEMCYSGPRQNLESIDDYVSFEIAILNEEGDYITSDFKDLATDGNDVAGWIGRGQINAVMILIQNY